ncbi:membrane protein insertase YidC [Methylocucumis oryzae]|uniref:Membrane protein insertase YidC n=1 Tax=Methylocucumis oryzae TaxID=1632867 RepID=A0A0F3IGV0_9GAMM|nr:membrane protein insertase YidC [Methylocucumis oryzae]KJV05927.1 membrane protein insertase [Methylocucumis oryzae]
MDNLRFLLIVALGTIVLMMTQAWEQDYGPKPTPSVAVNTESSAAKHDDLPVANNASTAPDSAQSSALAANSPPIATATKIVSIKTDVLDLEIDTQGGTIRRLDLLKYPVEKDNSVVNKLRSLIGLSVAEINHAPIRLLNDDVQKLFAAQSGLIADAGVSPAPDHYTVYDAANTQYTLADGQDELSVPLTWTNGQGISVTKTFTFKRNRYDIGLTQEVTNHSGAPWSGRQYNQLVRVPEEQKSNFMTGMRAYDGGVIYTEKNKYQKVSFDDMEGSNLDVASPGGWSAMIQHYFATAWIPPSEQENHFYTKQLPDGRFVIGSYSPSVSVADNSSVKLESQLFSGPKIQPIMEQVATGLELTVDYSVLTFIGKPIYSLLNFLHSVLGNWGFAIIGVTLCIKLLFFPLTQSSFRSMAKMRKIQPRLKELQERFKDDRMRFNNEMMALYKKEQVNPLGGCLPILIQIPVFMSLYWVLSETVEFRQAPFILWIEDLSVQDPFFILPIIMGITMKIQQSLNPAPIDPIQAKIIKMFPLVFTVFFLFFPAGLVLYWVVNNTLSILQQSYITKQIGGDGSTGH